MLSLSNIRSLNSIRSFGNIGSFIVFIVIMALVTLCIPPSAFAGYYSIGVGDGGEAKERSITLEAGSRNIRIKGKRFLAGIGIPIIDHDDDNIPSGIIDYPYPYKDYASLGRKTEGIETGLLGRFGMSRFHPDVYLSVIGGLTRVHEIHLVQSISTHKYYEHSSKNTIYWVYGISVAYFPELFDWRLKLNLQLDFDNRRGVTGCIGWCW